MIEIQNKYLKVRVNPVGAELNSLQLKHNQHELIWQADPAVWMGRAPILFPIVGRLINDTYTFNGESYSMPKHGLVRHQNWDVIETGKTHIVCSIHSSEETHLAYPFDWNLQVRFQLDELQLKVSYQVYNPGNTTLYFSLGSHPAFNLNFGSTQNSKYFIQFEGIKEPLQRYKLFENGLSTDSFPVEWDGDKLALTDVLFDEDALVFKNAPTRSLRLACTNNPRTIQFDTGASPDIGIWAKPRSPYVCLEPWFGYDEPMDHNQEFSKKPGVIELAAHQKFETHYAINLDENWF